MEAGFVTTPIACMNADNFSQELQDLISLRIDILIDGNNYFLNHGSGSLIRPSLQSCKSIFRSCKTAV